jgi:hypothetical protein
MIIQRLLYRSDSALTGLADDIDREVERIVEGARRRNEASGITGALMLSAGTFIQVLEGPVGAVEATFERICCDLRHRHVRLLELAIAEERVFADWAMVQVAPTLQLAQLCPSIGAGDSRLDASTASAAIQVMRTLLLTKTVKAPAALAAMG